MKYRGTITVFLSLILTLVLSVIMGMLESAAYAASRMKCEVATDMSLESVFAEYNRELLSRYDLYFIDTSYGSATPSPEKLKTHMLDYLSYNIDAHKGTGLLLKGADFPRLSVESLDIPEISYASDASGRVFKRQAIQALEDMYGISAAKALASGSSDLVSAYDGSGAEKEDPDRRRMELEQQLNGIDYKIPENPAGGVFDDRAGILEYVMSTKGISPRRIDTGSLISHRPFHKGTGLHGGSRDTESMISELMFNEYLFDRCSSYTDAKKDCAMAYEIEYILHGRNSDKANLRETAEKILMIRYGLDAAYIFTDSQKRDTVKGVAELVASILMVPEAAEPLADLILLAWAYGEAVSDTVRLMAGERVPLTKTAADWKMPLWGLLDLKLSARKTGSEGTGFSYEDYLKVFMATADKTKKCMRAMDVIESNLRLTPGNKNFRMDGCAEYVMVSAVMRSRGRTELTIDRKMSYLSDH